MNELIGIHVCTCVFEYLIFSGYSPENSNKPAKVDEFILLSINRSSAFTLSVAVVSCLSVWMVDMRETQRKRAVV